MWNCPACREPIDDDSWETCWKCGADRAMTPDQLAEAARTAERRRATFLNCLRCGSRMQFAGRREFHEGARIGFWLGNLGELFVNREALVIYACEACGKVDFYLDGVGNELRGDPQPV